MASTETAQTVWRCPECPTAIPVIVTVHRWKFGVAVYLSDTAMVDVFSHSWAHLDLEPDVGGEE